MADFGNLFASRFDSSIFRILGDSVDVSHPTLGDISIQAAFYQQTLRTEILEDRVNDYAPHMDIRRDHLYLFEDTLATVTYNGLVYEVYDIEPVSKLIDRIIFKDMR